MIMEAMRLSLLDHDEQRRRQKEEEEKKKREAAVGTQTAPAATAGSISSTSTPLTSATTLGDTTPPSTHLMPDTPNQTSPGSRVEHRSSSSLSRLSARLSPDRSPSNDRRSPSPIGALGAALRSATSAATAVASPPSGHEDTPTAGGADSLASIPQLASPDVELPEGNLVSDIQVSAHSNPSPPPALSPEVSFINTADPAPEVSPTTNQASDNSRQSTLDLGLRPDVQPLSYRSTSFASSILSDSTQNGETYDYLPSSPSSSSSSLAQKPLLDDSTGAGASEQTTPTPGSSTLHATTANE